MRCGRAASNGDWWTWQHLNDWFPVQGSRVLAYKVLLTGANQWKLPLVVKQYRSSTVLACLSVGNACNVAHMYLYIAQLHCTTPKLTQAHNMLRWNAECSHPTLHLPTLAFVAAFQPLISQNKTLYPKSLGTQRLATAQLPIQHTLYNNLITLDAHQKVDNPY